MKKRFCPGCKRWFRPKNNNHRYCSDDCRDVMRLIRMNYNVKKLRAKKAAMRENVPHEITWLPDNPFMGNVGLNCNSKWISEYGQGLVIGF